MIPLSGMEIGEEMYEKEGILPLISLMKVDDTEKTLTRVVEKMEKTQEEENWESRG